MKTKSNKQSQFIRNDEQIHALTTSFESRRELAVQTRGAIGLDLIFLVTFCIKAKSNVKQKTKTI